MAGFSSTASIAKADVDNMLRGLGKDNTDNSVTGTTNETDLATLSITADTIGATGGLLIIASGDITNSGSGAKTIRLDLGATTLSTISRTGANAQDWSFLVYLVNTATGAQRGMVIRSTTDANTVDTDFVVASEDTTGTLTLKVTGELANSADTIKQAMFDILIIQPT